MKGEVLSRLAALALFVFCSCSVTASTWAAGYPQRPITIVVPWPAGSSTGITAQKIANIINQNKISPKAMQVVFKPGGAGTVGLAEVLQGNPDGYTLAANPSAPILVQPLVKDLPYTSKTMIPIIQTAKFDWILTVKDDAPWKTLKEFLEYVKQHPGEVTVGSAGDYTWAHLAIMQITKATGLKFRHVPFAGSAPNAVALLGGHVQAAVLLTGDVSAQVAAGKARFLASVETKRPSFYPDVPTFRELGYDVQGTHHTNIIVAPKDTPKDVIEILHGFFKQAIGTEDYKAFLKEIGGDYDYVGYKELPEVVDKEIKKVEILLRELKSEGKEGK
jgi:tripartite-type tricarboxylate transporter receptor subunit TctC